MISIDEYIEIITRCKRVISSCSNKPLLLVTKDINYNIEKITNLKLKYDITRVHEGIDYEVKNKLQNQPNSFTDAVFWLNETLNFIHIFVEQKQLGESIKDSINTAYHRRLSQYHSFIIKGVFTVASRLDNGYSQLLDYINSVEKSELDKIKNIINDVDIILAGWKPK